MIRVLVADDHEVVRTALVSLIEGEPDVSVVAQAGSGETVGDLVVDHGCDVALLDVRMPVVDGLEAAEMLRDRCPDTAVVLLSADARPGHLRRALALGVGGFVSKNCTADRLLEAIRTARTGGCYLDPTLAADAVAADDCPLTPREMRALQLAQDGLSTSELATALGVRPHSARNLVSAAVVALEAENTVAAIRTARDAGWL